MKNTKEMKKYTPIKAYAVVSSKLNDYYTYYNGEGKFMAHAIFPRKKEALKFAQLCSAGYEKGRPRVIKVLINHYEH
jgi:hypothetical protein